MTSKKVALIRIFEIVLSQDIWRGNQYLFVARVLEKQVLVRFGRLDTGRGMLDVFDTSVFAELFVVT